MVVHPQLRRRRSRVGSLLKPHLDEQVQVSRLTELVASQRLRESGHPALSHVQCTCQQGVLRLTGRVSSYHLKQMAQSITLNIGGIERVQNHLEVMPLR